MTKLLNIDANAKTVKGQAHGYMTAVMYLAPYKSSGRNVCPMAELASCHEGCLNTAGRGGIAKRGAIIATDGGDLPDNAIQRARIWRTELYWNDRPAFMVQLVREVSAFVGKAKRAGLIPCVRLNGTSDIDWTRESCRRLSDGAAKLKPSKAARAILTIPYANIFEAFPDLQFYDYTKVYKRFRIARPANYHLSLSYSGASNRYASACGRAHREYGAPLVFVMRDKAAKARKIAARSDFLGGVSGALVDGDETDLRFTDPDGALVYLYAKGRARRDTSGFVID